MAWFSFPTYDDVAFIVETITSRQTNKIKGFIVATFEEVRAEYKAYAQAQKDRADAAEAALEDAVAAAQAAADALAAFQADDAATDASDLAAQAQANADALQSDLDDLRAVPVPEEPVEEPEDPPVEEPAEE